MVKSTTILAHIVVASMLLVCRAVGYADEEPINVSLSALFHRSLNMKGHSEGDPPLSCPCFGEDIMPDTVHTCGQLEDGSLMIRGELGSVNYCVSKDLSLCGLVHMNSFCYEYGVRKPASHARLDVCIDILETAAADAGIDCSSP